MKSNQVAHRKLTVPRRIDDIFEAGSFDEKVLAVREHLVMNQRMSTAEMLAQIIHCSTNLRQLDLVLAPERVQNVRFGEIAERQSSVRRIGELNDRLGSA